MVRDEREKLGSVVEVHESFIGEAEKGKPGRGAEKKALIILAVVLSSDEKTMGRIRFALIHDASGDSVVPFVETNVDPGSKVVADGWTGYLSLKTKGFSHEIKPMKGDEDMLPHVHRVFSLLKRWLLGSYQGGVQRRYLEYYLDEYTFRFNRRKSASRGKLFGRLIEQAVVTHPVTREELKVKSNANTDSLEVSAIL
jgi:transposase-like protein